jgi:hypothetical protein
MQSAAILIFERMASGMTSVAGFVEDEAALVTVTLEDQAASIQQSCARGVWRPSC